MLIKALDREMKLQLKFYKDWVQIFIEICTEALCYRCMTVHWLMKSIEKSPCEVCL